MSGGAASGDERAGGARRPLPGPLTVSLASALTMALGASLLLRAGDKPPDYAVVVLPALGSCLGTNPPEFTVYFDVTAQRPLDDFTLHVLYSLTHLQFIRAERGEDLERWETFGATEVFPGRIEISAAAGPGPAVEGPAQLLKLILVCVPESCPSETLLELPILGGDLAGAATTVRPTQCLAEPPPTPTPPPSAAPHWGLYE